MRADVGNGSDEAASSEGSLIPERYPQHDLFVCDVADAILKDIMQEMEHPFYSLSKKPETNIRRYEHNGVMIEVTPSVKGLATIYDKDILIYCISKVMDTIRRGEPASKRVNLNTHELLRFTNRGTAGKDYKAIVEALDRLNGTVISTNIRTGEEEQYHSFGLIEAAGVRRKFGFDGRLIWAGVTLSDWVFNAIRANEVLTLHRDYFRLRKPLERRLYELARKHCGAQADWRIGLHTLLKKSGSQSSIRRFRQLVTELTEGDHLPDYRVRYDRDKDQVVFINRGTVRASKVAEAEFDSGKIRLHAQTYEQARKVAPGWDIYVLEREWLDWITEPPRDPDRAFIGFCRKWQERRGSP